MARAAAGVQRQKYRNPYAYGESGADPTATADTAYVYSKDVGGRTEMFIEDDQGTVVQLTSAGKINSAAMSFPILAPDGAVGAPTYAYSSHSTSGQWMDSSGRIITSIAGTATFNVQGGQAQIIGANGSFAWGTSAGGADLLLVRDGAGILSQRNSTNAQTFRVFNTFTAGTPDYEAIEASWSSNVGILRTVANGTGSARALDLRYGNSTSVALRIGTALSAGVQILPATATGNNMTQGAFTIGNAGSWTATSGTNIGMWIPVTLTDSGTNSTTINQLITLAPTVNYTGASKTGKVYEMYLAPTATSMPSGQNAGLVFSSAHSSSTFPAIHLNNQADEDTNYEKLIISGGSQISNQFGIVAVKGGTGTVRAFNLYYGGTSSAAIAITGADPIDIAASNASSSTANGRLRIGNSSTATGTSGTRYGVLIADGPAPTATSTMAFYSLQITPTVNYSNGTPGAGYAYGLYINPTLTAQPTGRSAAIALSSTTSSMTGGGAICINNQTDEQTNYEQFTMGWASNVATLNVVKGGTGTQRAFNFQVGSNTIMSGNNSFQLILGQSGSSSGNGPFVLCGNASNFSATSGTTIGMQLDPIYRDAGTNSTTIAQALALKPTINYTAATKSGYVAALYINTTNTSLPTGLSGGVVLASTVSALTGGILWHNQTDEVTNSEYVYERFNSNVWEIGSVKLGTGTLRGLRIGITGNSLGFLGATPQARPAAYTLQATVVTSRTLLPSASATATNCNNVLAQLIQDLQGYGLLA